MMRRLHVQNTYKMGHLASCSPKAQFHNQSYARRPTKVPHERPEGLCMLGYAQHKLKVEGRTGANSTDTAEVLLGLYL